VALLLDVSGSVANILKIEKAAASQFFSNVLRPGDRALLVGFAQYVIVWQNLTSSRDDLDTALKQRAGPMYALSGAPPARGGTLLRDAVNLVASQKLKSLPGRKAMVLITDGEDNGSRASLDAAIKAAQEADAAIYGIHYEDAGMAYGTGRHVLNLMAGPTGGRTFHVDRKMTLEKAFAAIEEEMRNQYALGYPLPEKSPVPQFHKVNVKILKPGLKAQVRNGYYSIPR
jgi:VWFA-related protein